MQFSASELLPLAKLDVLRDELLWHLVLLTDCPRIKRILSLIRDGLPGGLTSLSCLAAQLWLSADGSEVARLPGPEVIRPLVEERTVNHTL